MGKGQNTQTGWPIVTKICIGDYIRNTYHPATEILDHTRRLLGDLHLLTKFRGDPTWHFEIIAIVLLRQFVLKIPIHAPKIGVFGDFNDIKETPKPKGAPLREFASFEQSSAKIRRRSDIGEFPKKISYISLSPIQKPRGRICTKFRTWIHLSDVTNVTNLGDRLSVSIRGRSSPLAID